MTVPYRISPGLRASPIIAASYNIQSRGSRDSSFSFYLLMRSLPMAELIIFFFLTTVSPVSGTL